MSAPVWAARQITIATTSHDGKNPRRKLVDAQVLEGSSWAVHPTPNALDSRVNSLFWTVTHTPSGFQLTNAARDEARARTCAEGLAALDVDWANLEPTMAAHRALPEAVRREMQAIRDAAI